MLKILLAIFALVYIHNLWKHFSTFTQVKRCLKKVTSFLNEYIALLKYSDIISRHVITPRLHCKDTEAVFFSHCKQLHSELWMLKQEKWHLFLRSLNPLPSVKDAILLPVTILSWLGFKPKKVTALLLTIVGWVITYLLEVFQPEVRDLIVAVFEQFIH